jgi:predicted alpha/beta hydrolase family esterase
MEAERSFLILHGLANHQPADHWQYWLAARLRQRGHQVLYPALPDPDTPSLAVWVAALREQLARMRGQERVAICHSLACLLWFHAAPMLAHDERVNRLLLVSPPASDRVPNEGASFRIESFDADSVRATVTGEIRIVCSDSDPYNAVGAKAMYADALDLSADVVHGAGHITPDNGYGPWPSLQDWCEGLRGPITTNRDPHGQAPYP